MSACWLRNEKKPIELVLETVWVRIFNFFHWCLFFCLFRAYCLIRGSFTHMATLTLLAKGCTFWPILYTYSHWAIRVLLMCHTYCVTDLLLIMVIPEDHWHCFRAFGRGAVNACYNDLCLFGPRIEPRSLACEANTQPLRHRGGFFLYQ